MIDERVIQESAARQLTWMMYNVVEGGTGTDTLEFDSSGTVLYDPVLGIYRGPNLDFVVNDLVQTELGGYLRRAVQDDLRGVRQSLRQQLRLR